MAQNFPLLFACIIVLCASDSQIKESDVPLPNDFTFEEFQNALMKLNIVQNQKTESSTKIGAKVVFGNNEFRCAAKVTSANGQKVSVHELRPWDVSIVAAMGDSLTAANGAKALTAVGLLTEYRGISWSIGGDKDLTHVTTLPNVLREFNADLRGYSLLTGDADDEKAHLNVAIPGSIAQDMPKQALELIQRLKSGVHGVDWHNDWKIITFFIGGNNLCRACKTGQKNNHTTDTYMYYVAEALDILHAEVPKAFVNLVAAPDVTEERKLNSGIVCATLHLYECPCGAYVRDEQLVEMQALVHSYNDALKELAESGRYDTREDFTVVYQPFPQNATTPTVKNKHGEDEPFLDFFAPDCFHFSDIGHHAAATAVWNNMLAHVDEKKTAMNVSDVIRCPDEDKPYFATYKNSDGRKKRSAESPPSRPTIDPLSEQTSKWLYTSLSYIASQVSHTQAETMFNNFIEYGLLKSSEKELILECLNVQKAKDIISCHYLHEELANPQLKSESFVEESIMENVKIDEQTIVQPGTNAQPRLYLYGETVDQHNQSSSVSVGIVLGVVFGIAVVGVLTVVIVKMRSRRWRHTAIPGMSTEPQSEDVMLLQPYVESSGVRYV